MCGYGKIALVVSGQSNAEGRGDPENLPDGFPEFADRITPEGRQTIGSRVGPGMPTAQELCRRCPNLLVDAAAKGEGGTSITEWIKGTTNYDALISQSESVITADHFPVLLWYQGEKDSQGESAASQWASRASQLFSDWRADLGLDRHTSRIVIVKLPATPPDDTVTYSEWSTVRAQQQSLETYWERVVEVPDSVKRIDSGVHLSTSAQLTLGIEIAIRLIR